MKEKSFATPLLARDPSPEIQRASGVQACDHGVGASSPLKAGGSAGLQPPRSRPPANQDGWGGWEDERSETERKTQNPTLESNLANTHLPELGTDLVTALAGLDVDDFSHAAGCVEDARAVRPGGQSRAKKGG